MLAYCLATGLTCNRKVYKPGDIFILPAAMEALFGGMTVSQLSFKQKKVYGQELFRFPAPDELTEAYRQNKIVLDWCTPKEKLWIQQDLEEKKRKIGEASDAIGRFVEEPKEGVEPTASLPKDKVKVSVLKEAEVVAPKSTLIKPRTTKPKSRTRRSPSKQKTKKG